MERPSVQQLFFQHIRETLPAHLSLAEEIAGILDISVDSAYRRIRGEKPISFEEIQRISAHFRISLDQFLELETDSFIFTGKIGDGSRSFLKSYLQNILQNLQFKIG